MSDAAYWIERLNLREHPEGGFYVETYRSAEILPAAGLPERYGGPRAMATAIYYLLRGDQVSTLHRLKGDEIWHHYLGCGLTIYRINAAGILERALLGCDPDRGRLPQTVISAGEWFGAAPDDPASYALVGCTIAPGFSFEDHEMGTREELLRRFPQHRAVIERLTS